MEALKNKTIITNGLLKLDVPSSYNNSEVEVLIYKIQEFKNKKTKLKNLFNYNLKVDVNILYPSREERNGR